jgi:hypothetical protein
LPDIATKSLDINFPPLVVQVRPSKADKLIFGLIARRIAAALPPQTSARAAAALRKGRRPVVAIAAQAYAPPTH